MTGTVPAWSIVVPTYGRGALLPDLLHSLLALVPPPGGYEIVLVDDGSPQPLDNIVSAFQTDTPLRLLRQDNTGPAGARNHGVAEARGQWIALTDDDCRPDAQWLVELARGLRGRQDTLIAGTTINGYPGIIGAETSQTLVDFLYSQAMSAGGALNFVTSNNMALSKSRFEALGGFDTGFPLAAGEDRDFCDRWIDAGGEIERAVDACIEHFHALTPRAFWRQHYNYGRGAYRVHRLRQDRSTAAGARTFERWSFYGNLIAYPVRKRRPRAWRQAGMLAVSQAATTAGYLKEAFTRGDRV